jgi:hypothetical protein
LLRKDKFIKESMQVRLINKSKIADGQMTSIAIKSDKNLIFQRQLGHKNDIPGSG